MRKPTRPEHLYVDFDGFFASCEEQANPRLYGCPIGVVPFEDARNSCVIASNPKAKKFGVRSLSRKVALRPACISMQARTPASCRSRPGGHDPGTDTDRKSGGGLAGGRQERAPDVRSHRAHDRLHLLAPEADLPGTVHLPASGLGAAGAVDRPARVTAALPASSLSDLDSDRFLFLSIPDCSSRGRSLCHYQIGGDLAGASMRY